ncbi:glutathione binding-like protein [Colwellia sp. 4_MG-2023]|uniref:glutathione S-transferase family protein n=1 Tax=unclassified Colwellia TaxID=196834 RepID=UPI001C0922F4|nr:MULTISPECIES: glutathione binding-like protein [unclassified Colwellia]MBU2924889.1 glutathione S-transferase N-terminal domain-containing protein [Colwellia sp. C2M11]MDO6506788.1 glutathione binding-like protein [Colwellia sp. 5_MG-2023]MDO6555837.1 glutathione binding-like protein [Colwellia sp. 4_MG-2023]MDO6652881.1 glutathione binding-like protein [Colwellia sp. 3_MG-2023]MDO6665883.1 glutathione binding-like protein [Colwellia sp. 2_MG-2023]
MNNIKLYMWATPNSRRISILFEELGLNFDVHPVNIRAKEQFATEITDLNPFGKVPIVVWQEREEQRLLFESGAILIQFAEAGKQFLPVDSKERGETLSWLMVALTGLGPHSASAHYWSDLAVEKLPQALDYHANFTARVYRLLDDRLADNEYLAGEYSIADMAAYPWISVSEWTTLNIEDYPNLLRWYQHVGSRPAVQRGMSLPTGISLD